YNETHTKITEFMASFRVFSPQPKLKEQSELTDLWWRSFFKKGEFDQFFLFLLHYIYKRGYFFFSYIEVAKDLIVGILYKRRGKFARPFLHTALMSILFVGISFGPLLVQQATAEETNVVELPSSILRTSTGDIAFLTEQSEEVARFRG